MSETRLSCNNEITFDDTQHVTPLCTFQLSTTTLGSLIVSIYATVRVDTSVDIDDEKNTRNIDKCRKSFSSGERVLKGDEKTLVTIIFPNIWHSNQSNLQVIVVSSFSNFHT